MTMAEKLLERLRSLGLDLPEGSVLETCRTGRAELSRGAWSWQALGPDGIPLNIGSWSTMARCLRAPQLCVVTDRFGETTIDIGGEGRHDHG